MTESTATHETPLDRLRAEAHGLVDIHLRTMTDRFGPLPEGEHEYMHETVDEIEHEMTCSAFIDQIKFWTARALTAKTRDDVFFQRLDATNSDFAAVLGPDVEVAYMPTFEMIRAAGEADGHPA